ncbi:putative ACC deaminase [Fusarium austroafricanum]|uniref:Putative ACC deaminase n=1 Tax=Fusarium austroafricanum TaxID=2364996 RepID=A0A8H4KIA3_9HYPO|nr:putative ACC deaminase [Fusarium austroafricanum]
MVNLPSPFSDIPRVQLLFDRPSDIEPLSRLSASIPGRANLWIAREDRNSGLAFAGNKVRKLEYVLADALAQGANTLVTTGGVQSNHMCQTSAAAARLGLKVALYPADRVASNDAEYRYLGNIQANGILGAETFPVDTSEEEVIKTLKERGQKPYSIPAGASTHPLGGLGYARWAFELLEQEKKLNVTFDVIALVAGSCSTIGGILAGLKLAQKEGILKSTKHLIGFSVLHSNKDDVVKLVLDIAKNAASKIGVPPDEITADDFEINTSYIGEGYGQLNDVTAQGMKDLARAEGILTDPVYTGKAITGLLHTVNEGEFEGKNVLFVHTGGQAVLGAYPRLR